MFKKLFNKFKKDTMLRASLSSDHELFTILKNEKHRQMSHLELIASENFTSTAVLEANGTIFTNKYAEGYPKKRYYGGCEHIDSLEELCQQRALEAFLLDNQIWGVNVQSYSGSTANFSVYAALLKPGEKLMGLDLPSGGHLTHGYSTPTKKISNSAIFFDSKPYKVGDDFLINYDELEESALTYKPNLIIVGASAYPRDFDYKRFREIADKCNAYLMADIAHISGLVAAKQLRSPFEYCDVVTTTTHKTLRGPRAALIFYKNKYKDVIDFSVFPGSQGGAHFNTVAAVATALKQVNTQHFHDYAKQVVRNAKHLAKELQKCGFDVVTNGTDNHIVLVNLKTKGVTGSKFEKLAELCNVSVNKNTIATDSSALNPSGIRLGTAAMTTRGFREKEFEFVANVLNDVTDLAVKIQNNCSSKKLIDFLAKTNEYTCEIDIIKKRVSEYCQKYMLPS